MPNIFLVLRTLVHLKPAQLWFQVWRRLQRKLGPHPACSTEELPEFTFLNLTARPKGWNDSSLELLWRYNLHYFCGMGGMETGGGKDVCRGGPWWVELAERWIRENPRGSAPGWDPYPTSLRIVNWVKSFEEGPGRRSAAMEESLAEQMDWLAGHLEYQILANHYLANLKALVVGSVALGRDCSKWLRRYLKQIDEQVLSDGGHYERSAMYHAIVLEDVLDVIRFCGEKAAALRPVAERMLRYLAAMTGPDGRIAKFNDAADGIAETPAELVAQAGVLGLGRGLGDAGFPDMTPSGFVRRGAGRYTLIAKCGEIGPSYQPGHAHADTFSFELWDGVRKIAGDTGCSTYVPGPVRSYERSTAAHNTVVIDGRDSSEVWASHRVGRRFDARRHRRTFALTEKGLAGVDELNGCGEHDVEVRFHLPPGISADEVTIDCPGERVVESCDFADGWNRRATGTCVFFRKRLRFPARLAWSFASSPRS